MFWPILISGLAATTVMSLFLSLVHRSNLADGDMIRAVGSLFTRAEKGSLLAGTVIHYSVGMLLAVAYAAIVRASPVSEGSVLIIGVCVGVSFFHGLLVSMMTAIVVAEHHPLPRFRRAGADVVITYLLAHVVYGLTLGLLFYWFAYQPPIVLESILH